ncbi:uncharacterized protein BXZ73DRAFT_106178 [Epithele typhae]|uniref:uncharacterized protein n=1 Tax=Epithele typhae TaxID=378194 RepID=UPI0020077147|nr:uncharacterized protein BXZ73DRAFT_106178 [Epithele typhae]KAH9915449.1 hypothetical protein BXZ73DRAFT_106178 [Epithele typhae]
MARGHNLISPLPRIPTSPPLLFLAPVPATPVMNPYHPDHHLSLPFSSNHPHGPRPQVPTTSGSFAGERTTPTNIDLFQLSAAGPARPATQPIDYYDHTSLVHPAIQQGFPDIYPLTTIPPVIPTFREASPHQEHPPTPLSHTVTGSSEPVQSHRPFQSRPRAVPQHDHRDHLHPILQQGSQARYPAAALPPIASTPRVVPSSYHCFPPPPSGHTVTGDTQFFPSHEYVPPIPRAAPLPQRQGAPASTNLTEWGPPPAATTTRKRRAPSEAGATPSKKAKTGFLEDASASISTRSEAASGDDDDDDSSNLYPLDTPIRCRWPLDSGRRCNAQHTLESIVDHTLGHVPDDGGKHLCMWEDCDSTTSKTPSASEDQKWQVKRRMRVAMGKKSLERHLRQCHFRLDDKHCRHCGTSARSDVYNHVHGPAKYCKHNPKNASQASSHTDPSPPPAASSGSTPEFVQGSSGGSSASSATEEPVETHPFLSYAAPGPSAALPAQFIGFPASAGTAWPYTVALPHAPRYPSARPSSLSATHAPTFAPTSLSSVPPMPSVSSLPAATPSVQVSPDTPALVRNPEFFPASAAGSNGALSVSPNPRSVSVPPTAPSWPILPPPVPAGAPEGLIPFPPLDSAAVGEFLDSSLKPYYPSPDSFGEFFGLSDLDVEEYFRQL